MSTNRETRRVILALNAGSSSLKAALIREDGVRLASFLAEPLGTEQAVLQSTYDDDKTEKELSNSNYESALQEILESLQQRGLLDKLVATGHRVVHGGDKFTASTLVDDSVLEEIESVSHLAPLHNPQNIKGIKALQKMQPSLPIVAVFDTSFHTTLPDRAKTYPIPKKYRDIGIQKYGFHGTSVRFVVNKSTVVLSKIKDKKSYNMVVCHLGNGASVTAVAGGKSVETSMGFSPLPGLMMGTRSGDIDPAVVSFAMDSLGLNIDEALNDLNKESGLKAMVDMHDSDMRSILKRAEEGHEDARLAVEMFSYRVAQHIAKSLVTLPGPVDAIVFTGGIGEHAPKIRQACLQYPTNTVFPGLVLDKKRNESGGADYGGVLTAEGAIPVCLEIATDEEAMIAQDCFEIVAKGT